MLHALAAERPTERSGGCTARATAASTPFAAEAARCSRRCPTCGPTSATAARPERPRRSGLRQRGPAHVDAARRTRAAADAEAYLCGPTPFMEEIAPAWSRSASTPAHPHRAVRAGARADARRRGAARAAPHPPAGEPGKRPDDRVRAQQPRHPVERRLREPARARRSVRRARPLVVPHRRLPQLRDGLMAGTVDYSPEPVEPPADGSALICCSQPPRRRARSVTEASRRDTLP